MAERHVIRGTGRVSAGDRTLRSWEFRDRSMAGTLRAAESGVWMGGIVPYGYRRTGEKREARIVISDEPIPGMAVTASGVIRDVFRMATIEQNPAGSSQPD